MAKVQKLEESLCATEKVISSLEKSRDADKVGKVEAISLCIFVINAAFTIPVSCSQVTDS